jgi:hypothetical protein
VIFRKGDRNPRDVRHDGPPGSHVASAALSGVTLGETSGAGKVRRTSEPDAVAIQQAAARAPRRVDHSQVAAHRGQALEL